MPMASNVLMVGGALVSAAGFFSGSPINPLSGIPSGYMVGGGIAMMGAGAAIDMLAGYGK